MEVVLASIRLIGPFVLVSWGILAFSVWRKPQRFSNSVLLMIALFFTAFFIAGLFGEKMWAALLGEFLLGMLFIFIVPLLFIINGIVMIHKESLCLAHVLSLVIGIGIGLGELAGIFMVLGAAEIGVFQHVDKYLFFFSFTVFYLSLQLLCFMLYTIFIRRIPHIAYYDYVIIHGCGLASGYRVTKLLSSRIDKAIEVYNKCQHKPYLIASGGQGSDEKISEAQAIANYLLEHGIPADRIILEDRSTTTMENLVYSKEIIDSRGEGNRVALVSNNYHIYRCITYAKKIGMNCVGIGGGVAAYYWPTAVIREFIALFKSRKFIIWSIIGYILFMLPNSLLLYYL